MIFHFIIKFTLVFAHSSTYEFGSRIIYNMRDYISDL